MANNLTNYSEAEILQWLMTDETVARPTAWYVALFSAAPGEAGGGTELTGNGYARQAVDFGTDGLTNTAAVEFTAAGGNWVEATHMAILDASTSGNMLWYGPLSPGSKQIDDGDSIRFAAGEIDLSLD